MTSDNVVKKKLLELLETVPHPQRLYPDLYVDMLIENGVTIHTCCRDCKYYDSKGLECTIKFDSDGERLDMSPHYYCSDGKRRK